jgi:hypothetical protein
MSSSVVKVMRVLNFCGRKKLGGKSLSFNIG